MAIRKIQAGRILTVTSPNFIGEKGAIFYDETLADLRIGDGITPGGTLINTGTLNVDLSAVTQNITPGVDAVYSLGTPSLKWKDIYVSTGSVYIGDLKLSSVNGALKVENIGNTGSDSSSVSIGTVRLSDYNSSLKISSPLTFPDGTTQTSAASSLEISEIDTANSLTNTVTNVTAIRFDKDTGFSVTNLGNNEVKISLGSSFKTWKVDGQQDLIAVGEDTIRLIAGTGVTLATDPNAAIKTLTISAEAGAGTGSTVIKTFNILNEFTAPLMGKAIYIPDSSTTIRSVQLVNGIGAVGADLMVGLYRNNELLNFFTIPAGNIAKKYTNLDYFITPSDYISVNVVSGQGGNFNMVLFNA